jgi:hypothetical protein
LAVAKQNSSFNFMPQKAFARPIQKSEQLAKLMTTKVRGHVKPGSTTFDSTGEVVSIIAAAFSKTPREFDTKTTTGFPSGWTFHCRNGTR